MKKKNKFQADLNVIQEYIDVEDSPGLKAYLEVFSQLNLPAVKPKKFRRQVLKDLNQRKMAMIGGYPYTSNTHPWPKDEMDGNLMQPIAQLDLDEVGKFLSLNLGQGLIQIWCPVDPALTKILDKSSNPFLIRVVPRNDLTESPLSDYPASPVWLEKASSFNEENENADLEERMFGEPRKFFALYKDSIVQNPLIEWAEIDQMFPLEFGLSELDIELSPDDFENSSSIFESLMEKITCPRNGSIYLGGYGGAAGGDSDPTYISPSVGRLLIHIPTDQSLIIGLIARFAENRAPQFEIVHRYF
jgi:hypothetical protein